MKPKNYAVILRAGTREVLGNALGSLLKSGKGSHDYFLASKIDPNGRLFYMEVNLIDTAPEKTEMQVHIPHEWVFYVIAARDLHVMGFT